MRRGGTIVTMAVVALFVVSAGALAEPLSKIAVIDIDRVFESFPEQARVFRELNDRRDAYEERMNEYSEQIDDLELKIIDAKKAENDVEVARLEREREDVLQDRRTYHEIMTRRIKDAYRRIAEGEGIVGEILKVIDFVAVDEGYSIVLDAGDSRIFWFSKEIDITDMVISRLRAISLAEQKRGP